jgi:hypothetical protein
MRFNAILGCMFAVAAMNAAAAPVYYSFEGTVTYSIITDIAYGQTVHYTFMADLNVDGYSNENGILIHATDAGTPGNSIDYFYSDYVGGDAIAVDPPSSFYGTLSYHMGYSQINLGFPSSLVLGSNGDPSGYDYAYAYSDNSPIGSWYVGQSFQGYNAIGGAAGVYDAYSDLTLVAIGGTNPLEAVPEPSTLALLVLGVVVMAAVRKRKA